MTPEPDEKPSLETYYHEAARYVAGFRSNGGASPHAVLSKADEEWLLWGAYFLRSYGKLPSTMEMVIRGERKDISFPAKYPEWFDKRYEMTGPVTRSERMRLLGQSEGPFVTSQERAAILAKYDGQYLAKAKPKDMRQPDWDRRRHEREARAAETDNLPNHERAA